MKEIRPRLTPDEYNLILKHRGGEEVPPPETKKVKIEESSNSSTVEGTISTTETDRVKILDDFLLECRVDLSEWEVDRYVLNAWDVTMKFESVDKGNDLTKTKTNYQIKVWLKRKTALVASLESFIRGLEKRQQMKPVIEVNSITTDLLYEVCLYDLHFGKLCWKPETGSDYDLKIAEKDFSKAIDKFFMYASVLKPERILFPIGNDFLHIVNELGTTEKGTPLDVDGRLPKIFDVAYNSILSAIEKFLTVAPVDIEWVKSNHDGWLSYFLCRAIAAYYTNNKNITIDISPKSRKMYEWGNVLLGFEHGEVKPERLPLLMADEWPEAWARTRFREWHVGHLHKKQEMIFTSIDTVGSIIYRRIPSLTKTDAWHYQHGFVNKIRAAECYVWHKHDGLVNSFPIYLD
jgi:hypothetical protein